ncbi:MAG: hypothetical protein H6Q66_3056 [Firmicutes bacterium]|nr:hypothetical protein [Bacillota bacterium]
MTKVSLPEITSMLEAMMWKVALLLGGISTENVRS